MMSSSRPTKIGKYDVVDVIGRGGMGIVYKGADPHLGRLVAIKMMTGPYGDNPELLKRFYREAQSTGSLQHPNIVTVYELGDQGGNPYLVMEYLEGESLNAIINSRRPLGLLEKINLIIEVCQGLSYAHHRGIVHRDIKPANIMVLKDGGVKIVDFGIAHIGDKTVTRTGQIMGSLCYMSPEQINAKVVDARSDIFSTGVVLYQLFTYNLPFEADNTAATLLKIIHEPPPPLRKYIEQVYPTDLEDIVLRSLAKDRDNRYQSAEDLAFDLGQVRDQMKREVINQHMSQAELLLSQQQLVKAKEQLLSVLKMDRQNTRAVQLMRSVAQRIQQEEAVEQVRQLRAQAEEALQQEQFESALGFVERALALNRTNPELQRLRANIQQAKARFDELQVLLQRSESAHQRGDLDLAKQAVEEALGLAPNDVHAKALYRLVQRDWVERSRQRQLGMLLDSARKELSSRRFTAALDLLRQAEALDPNLPQLRSLIEAANSGREQEVRRKELEQINHEIEAALDRDDFWVACAKADEGLRRFPDDRGLQKLKALAEKQREIVERKRFIDDQLARARQLLESGRAEEVLSLLQTAQQKVGGDTHLDSLLAVVRETVERQRAEARKAEYLRQAKEALRRKAYDESIATLRRAHAELGPAADIDDLLQLAQEQAASEKRRQIADAAAAKAHGLIADERYDEAITVLKAALRDAPEEDLSIILLQAEQGAREQEQRLQSALASASEMLRGRKAAEAIQYLESQPAAFSRNPAFRSLLLKAREQADLQRHIAEASSKVRALLAQNDFAGALRLLQENTRSFGRASEIDALSAEVEQRRSAAAGELVQAALADARMLMGATEYRAVIERLNAVSEQAAIAPSGLRAEYQTLQQQATGLQARQHETRARQLLFAGDHLQATGLLQQALTEFPQDRGLAELNRLVEQAAQKRREAQNLLAEAQKIFLAKEWKQGGDLCLRASALADGDPVVRKQASGSLQQAAQSAVASDWRSAEVLIQKLEKVQAGLTADAHLQSQIAEAKQREAILACLNEAKSLQSKGNLQQALVEVQRGLSISPEEVLLLELRATIQRTQRQQEEHASLERERLQRRAYLDEIRQRVQREAAPDRRIIILEEGLRTYPDELALRQELDAVRSRWDRVSALTQQAKSLEESRKFNEAIEVWQTVRTLDARHPELVPALERLHRLQEQARNAARSNWLQKIQKAFTAFDYDEAASLLLQAQKEFPADWQLEECKKDLNSRVKAREKSLKLVADAHKFFDKQRWEKGLQSLREAAEIAKGDPAIRQQAHAQLIKAAELAALSDSQIAEQLLREAEELDSGSSEVIQLRTRIERDKRQRIIAAYLEGTNKLQSAGDLQGALNKLERGLTDFPDEHELLRARHALEALIQAKHRLEERKALEEQVRRAQQQEKREREKQEKKRILELEQQQREEKKKQRDAALEEQRRLAVREDRETPEHASTFIDPASPESLAAPPAKSRTLSMCYADLPGWQEDFLKKVEKELAVFIGPLAGILVYRAASRGSEPEELYKQLAANLERDVDRQVFLARKTEVLRYHDTSRPTEAPAEPSTSQESAIPNPRPEFTAETIERAASMLAPYVGPISRVLAKKAAQRADNLRSLYLILADHLEKKNERASFLRDSGITDSN